MAGSLMARPMSPNTSSTIWSSTGAGPPDSARSLGVDPSPQSGGSSPERRDPPEPPLGTRSRAGAASSVSVRAITVPAAGRLMVDNDGRSHASRRSLLGEDDRSRLRLRDPAEEERERDPSRTPSGRGESASRRSPPPRGARRARGVLSRSLSSGAAIAGARALKACSSLSDGAQFAGFLPSRGHWARSAGGPPFPFGGENRNGGDCFPFFPFPRPFDPSGRGPRPLGC